MSKLKVFLSYSTDDKRLAGMVKQQLAYFGIEVFLAHEDLLRSFKTPAECGILIAGLLVAR